MLPWHWLLPCCDRPFDRPWTFSSADGAGARTEAETEAPVAVTRGGKLNCCSSISAALQRIASQPPKGVKKQRRTKAMRMNTRRAEPHATAMKAVSPPASALTQRLRVR